MSRWTMRAYLSYISKFDCIKVSGINGLINGTHLIRKTGGKWSGTTSYLLERKEQVVNKENKIN